MRFRVDPRAQRSASDFVKHCFSRSTVGRPFGVSAAEAPRAALPRFDPGSGAESLGVQGLVSIPVSQHWRWTAIVRGESILGDRADSPVVDTPTQLFFLTALTRAF